MKVNKMLDEAFAVYLMAFEHARKYVEKTKMTVSI